MFSKFLERKVDLMPSEETSHLTSPIKLEYYLLESNSTDSIGSDGNTIYGIEVVKKTGNETLESELVRNLSSCSDSVKSILSKLAQNSVTPVALPFVLDDLIGV
ncbi:MAG TPA: DUF6514 family protein [Clostridia bacterium]